MVIYYIFDTEKSIINDLRQGNLRGVFSRIPILLRHSCVLGIQFMASLHPTVVFVSCYSNTIFLLRRYIVLSHL